MIRRVSLVPLLVLAGVLASPAISWAADPQILTNATQTIVLPFTGTSVPMNVEYHPHQDRYYGALGGNRSQPGFVWDTQGNPLDTRQPIGVDVRSFFYNPNTGNLEVATYNAKNGSGAPTDTTGIRIMNLNASGFFDGTTTSALGGVPGLSDTQVMPAYDPARNQLFSRIGNKIHVVDRGTGARIDSVIIDTTGLGPSALPSFSLGYDSSYEVFITAAYNPGRVLVHRRNGTRVGISRLPDTLLWGGNYGMGYANGQVFLNNSKRAMSGFRIFSKATRTVSTAAGQYALVGFPVIPSSPRVDSIFVPQLGPVDSTVWRLGRWAPAQNAYAAPFYSTSAGRDLASIGPRDGYWLGTKASQTVSVVGDPIPNSFDAPLANGPGGSAGWNMVSGHFQAAIPVANVQVRSGGVTQSLTSAANTLTDRVLWTWTGSGYTSVGAGGSIPAGTAFWIRKVSAAAVSLIAPGLTTPSPQPGPLAADEGRAPSEGAAWELTLEARQGERVSNPAVMGVADVDPSRWNPMSYALPPAPPVPALRLAFHKHEWGELSGDYAADYQPAAATQAWDLVLSGAEGPGELTLSVSVVGVPAGMRLALTDLDRGATWEFGPGTPLTLAATGGERRLRVTATAGGPVLPPTAIAREGLSFVYPNPFSRTTGLTFALARSADIDVELYDIVGRRVAGLSRKAAAAGEHVLVWDGRDDGGRAVQSGVYFARWAVGGERGTRRLVKVE